MAIYEYQCTLCNKIHEIWQKMSDEPIKLCPDCSGPVNKLISSSTFQLTGGGWYADSYSKKQKKTPQNKEAADQKNGNSKVGSDTNKSKNKVSPNSSDN
jgi:putative FmdB family regulatory protein